MDERSTGTREIIISIDGEAKYYTRAANSSFESVEADVAADGEVETCVPTNEVSG